MTRLLDQHQFRWWHRLRRMGPILFAGGLGGVVTTSAVILLHVVVVKLLFDAPLGLASRRVMVLGVVLGPVCVGAFAWTWWLMERRYRTTLAQHCPQCGYALRGNTTGVCPECGAVRSEAAL